MKNCPNCGEKNPKEAKFCFNCGGDLEEKKSEKKPTSDSGRTELEPLSDKVLPLSDLVRWFFSSRADL